MLASIGLIASPAQGAGYFERDGYYSKDDPAHREASAWAGRGAEALGLTGPVDSDTFRAILEGKVPDGPHLGKRDKDGEIHHFPGRDVIMLAPKSVSFMALLGGDERIGAAHDRAVGTTLGWIERNAVLTRLQDSESSPEQVGTGAMVHAGDQKTVVATFRHGTSRNLDPQLHTRSSICGVSPGSSRLTPTPTTTASMRPEDRRGLSPRQRVGRIPGGSSSSSPTSRPASDAARTRRRSLRSRWRR